LKKGIFIAWTRYHQRTEFLAHKLGIRLHYIYSGNQGRLLHAPIRFIIQAWQTWRILRREFPEFVFIQNPPIFCVLIAFIYSWRYGARYVIDSHTAAFLSPRWRWSLWLHRLLSTRALMTIVHNSSQGKMIKSWGCSDFVLGDYPGPRAGGVRFHLDGQFNVAVISSFATDEPLDIVFEAAGGLPEINFYVTGDSNRIAPRLLAKKPHNCSLTGYLPHKRYLGLLQGVDAIIALTTRNHTLLSGAWEAVSIGKPLIVSDWPILKHCFSQGTVHVPNTAEGVYRGVRRVQAEHDILQQDMLKLRDQLTQEWELKFRELQEQLGIG
jgi:hypothetical protein